MPSPLTEVRQDLSELRDHDVVGCQSRLSLKDGMQQTVSRRSGPPVSSPFWEVQFSGSKEQYLHAGAVGFTADQRGRDVGVRELIIQVHHIGHPARQEELVPLYLT